MHETNFSNSWVTTENSSQSPRPRVLSHLSSDPACPGHHGKVHSSLPTSRFKKSLKEIHKCDCVPAGEQPHPGTEGMRTQTHASLLNKVQACCVPGQESQGPGAAVPKPGALRVTKTRGWVWRCSGTAPCCQAGVSCQAKQATSIPACLCRHTLNNCGCFPEQISKLHYIFTCLARDRTSALINEEKGCLLCRRFMWQSLSLSPRNPVCCSSQLSSLDSFREGALDLGSQQMNTLSLSLCWN